MLRQILAIWVIAFGVAAIGVEAIVKTGFGALGQTPGDPAWSYVIALLVTWGISGAGSAARAMTSGNIGKIAGRVSAIASGAFLGFFYVGVMADQHPQAAIVGAVGGGILAGMAMMRFRRRLMGDMAVAITGSLHGYGFALLIGIQAIDRLSAEFWFGGLIWGLVSILYLFFTVSSFGLAVRIARKALKNSLTVGQG